MKFTRKDKRTNLEKEIDSVLERMSSLDPDSKEYTDMMNNLGKLFDAKSKEKDRKISPDTIVIVACSLLEIVLMLNFEKTGVITSKALGFVIKGRV